MNVVWTNTAQRHLDSIYDYIAQDSKHYALTTIDKITHRSIQIMEFPLSGRIVPEFDVHDVREVIEGKYRIIYHIASDRIEILAILHGAQEITKNIT